MAPGTAPLPWRPNHLIVLYGSSFLGAASVVASWWGSSGTADLGSQLRWVNAGVGGLILMGSGYAVWLLHGRRAVTVRRRQLLAGLAAAPAAAPAVLAESDRASRVVAAARMTRYHLPTCPLVVGKSVKAGTLTAQERAGRRPCGVCSP